MAGRRPKPTALKILEGNPGHRPLNEDEPQPEIRAPEMPKTLSRAARREFHFIKNALIKLRVLTDIDGKALACYCEAYAEWEQACRDVRKYGQLIEEPVVDKLGHAIMLQEVAGPESAPTVVFKPLVRLKENPAVRTRNNAAKTMKSFLTEFGLTPASRVKLKIGKKTDEDPGEDFFNRQRKMAKAGPLLIPQAAPSQQ